MSSSPVTGRAPCLAFIGGTSVYKIEGLTNIEEVRISTPFGDPSDAIVIGTLHNLDVCFLPRHGRTHSLTPSEVPYAANIYALKTLGVTHVISVSAVGSLVAENCPAQLVLPTQFLDRTLGGCRRNSFFGDGCVAHVSFGRPVCMQLHALLASVCQEQLQLLQQQQPGSSTPQVHLDGTYVCIEGPAFSTAAESQCYRMLGGTIIGMTGLPEAKLAREAEMAYAMLALVTDYDAWHPDHEAVTVDIVIENLHRVAGTAQSVISELCRRLGSGQASLEVSVVAHNALRNAVLTPKESVPPATGERLQAILSKYWNC